MFVNDPATTSNCAININNLNNYNHGLDTMLRRASTASTPPRSSPLAEAAKAADRAPPPEPAMPFEVSDALFPRAVVDEAVRHGATLFEVKAGGNDEGCWRALLPSSGSVPVHIAPPADVLTSNRAALVELLEAVEETGGACAMLAVPKARVDLAQVLRGMTTLGFRLIAPSKDDTDGAPFALMRCDLDDL